MAQGGKFSGAMHHYDFFWKTDRNVNALSSVGLVLEKAGLSGNTVCMLV